MKKLFGSLILALLFAFAFASAQGIVGVKSHDFGTIANSVDESYISYTYEGLLKDFGCAKIDSILISMTVKNETDVDSLMWYPVNWTVDGTAVNGTVKTFTVTLNIAAAGTGTEVLKVTNAGVASSLWRGYEGFRVFTRGAAAGNDVTGSNANSCKVTFTFYGS